MVGEVAGQHPKTDVPTASNDSAASPADVLPHNFDAEQVVLGGLLVKNGKLNDIGDFLKPEHFFDPMHGRIYESINHFVDKGLLANPVTLKNYFEHDEALKELGGAAYLAEMAAQAGIVANIRDYAQTIFDLAMRRELIELSANMKHRATFSAPRESAMQQVEMAEQSLFNLAANGQSERAVFSIGEALTQSLERAETAYRNRGSVSGLTTGFIDMDKLLGGFQNSDLIILAGRPSMGKTALATTIAYEASKALHEQAKRDGTKQGSIALFSLEMSAEQLSSRLLACVTGVNSSRMRKGELNQDEFSQLVQGAQDLSQLGFYIDDTPAISISSLRTRARRLKRMHNIGLIVVDYLQLMQGSSAASQQNRVQEISEITQGLKAIAKEINVPVIALSQLSRAVEQREDKRPQLSDLRESGSIEQDADIVMFVFREEYYLARSMPREGTPKFEQWQQDMDAVHGIAEVIIAKQRHGPIGTVKLHFHGDTTRFGNLVQEGQAPAYG